MKMGMTFSILLAAELLNLKYLNAFLLSYIYLVRILCSDFNVKTEIQKNWMRIPRG